MRNFAAMVPPGTNKRNRGAMSDPTPDVTLIFAEDVLEWDTYLSRQLEGLHLHRQQLERLAFPLAHSSHALRLFGQARVALLVLSPAMVRFLDLRADDCAALCRLLPPNRTIAMLCGVEASAVEAVKNVLISYDSWRHLEAKDKDVQMARAVIEMIHESLAQAKLNERLTKPKFKLVPRKVMEGNGKVYIMLAKAVDMSANIRVTLEADGAKEVTVKKRNPYTLVFVIPDDLIHVQTLVTVCVWEEEELLGVSSIKCVSKLGELHSLLSTATSPYAFLCSTLGLGALSEADQRMAEVFRKNKPANGFHLLEAGDATRTESHTSEELPSLLHFSARYGLSRLATELLACPGARAAASRKNARGLTPAQMANYEGHNQVAALIDTFVIDSANDRKEKHISLDLSTRVEKTLATTECHNPMDNYDIPATPTPVTHDRDYLNMKGAQKENVEPNCFLEEHLDSMRNTPPNTSEKSTLSLLESQAKLIDIMEAYKKGASLTEVEKLHNEWKVSYQVSETEAKGTLDGLRNLYAKAQKAKMNKKHSTSFSELRHFLNSKLKRKDSSTSIDSKGSLRNSEKSTTEPETLRPISILSNASTSSGSSFDRLSMASAGSDSGHHSDFGDDRHETKDLRCMRPPKSYVNFPRTTLNLKSKPPAPPPRPLRCEDCYSLPSSRSSSLSSDYRRKASLPLAGGDFCNMENYDLVPPPRPSSSLGKPIDTRLDYDMVPPPLPLSPLQQKPPTPVAGQLYDFPCVSAFYDLPRSSDTPAKEGVVKNCVLGGPPRSLTCVVPPSPPPGLMRLPTEDYDIPRSSNTTVSQCSSNSNKPVMMTPPSPMDDYDIPRSLEKAGGPVKIKYRPRPQYCNVTIPLREEERDSIPEEMAPPPPV